MVKLTSGLGTGVGSFVTISQINASQLSISFISSLATLNEYLQLCGGRSSDVRQGGCGTNGPDLYMFQCICRNGRDESQTALCALKGGDTGPAKTVTRTTTTFRTTTKTTTDVVKQPSTDFITKTKTLTLSAHVTTVTVPAHTHVVTIDSYTTVTSTKTVSQ
jgi:hypothetical protein